MLENRRITLSRRSALQTLGAIGAAAVLPGLAPSAAVSAQTAFTDEDIFNFALNLESLEAEYYLRGMTGQGMATADAGPNPGSVSGGGMVPWANDDLRQFMEEIARNELSTCASTAAFSAARQSAGRRSTSPVGSGLRRRRLALATTSIRSPAR